MRHNQGVTLIELMVVVVVVAILASIAVPSYRSYVIRAQRTDATAALLRARTAQEKFFLQNNRFMTDDDFAGLGLNVSEHRFYDVDRADGDGVNPALGYVLTATPMAGGAQAVDTTCASFTINESAERGSDPGDETKCWK